MNGKQLCCMRDISFPATLYYVIILKIRGKVTTAGLFIILRQVTTVTNHNKKIIDRLCKTAVTKK